MNNNISPHFEPGQNYVFRESVQYLKLKIYLKFIEIKNDKYSFKSEESVRKQFPFESARSPNHYVVTDEKGKKIVMQYESKSFDNNNFIYTFSFVDFEGSIFQHYKPFSTLYPPSTLEKFKKDSRVSYRSNSLNPLHALHALKKKGGTRRKKKTPSRRHFNSKYTL